MIHILFFSCVCILHVCLLDFYLNLNVICVFAMSVVGHDCKLDMFSYTIPNVSIFIDMCFDTCWHLV